MDSCQSSSKLAYHTPVSSANAILASRSPFALGCQMHIKSMFGFEKKGIFSRFYSKLMTCVIEKLLKNHASNEMCD